MASKFTFLRAAVRNLIPLLSKTFTSASSALGFLKSEGMGMRRQTFLSDWREITKAAATRIGLKYVRLDRTPSDKLVSYYNHDIQNKFQVIGDVKYTNALTGRKETKRISFLTGRIKERGVMENTLWDIADQNLDEYDMGEINNIILSEIRSSDKKYA